ncbi:SCP-like extracellular [Cohnella pontilimi]|uniref:SCP-like extracellular n=2 Tax=Cohnella pontilimi TaxID=2564100 RepID=A0A4U0FDE9_9BACL|nr:SCP-like extracellular [Cohnella pontilimi]
MLTVGALALAISAPAATASAATTTNVQYKVYYYTQGSNADVNAWIQQYLRQVQAQYPQYRWTYQPVAQKPAAKPVTTKPSAQPAKTGTTAQVSNFASQVFNLVNQERAKAGLKALKLDSALSNMALVKAKDMKNNNYFSHNSPTYGSPFDMMKKFGISYGYAGENIAMGQKSPQEVMTAWMNSPGHKANILSQNFSKIGVAYYNGEWVQEFTG